MPSEIGNRWVFAVRIGGCCDSLVLRQTTGYAIVLFEGQKCGNEGFSIISDMLTVFGCSRKRERVAASGVPSVESPGSISYLCCLRVEQGLTISIVLAQRCCCCSAADSAVEQIGRELHLEIFYIRLNRCN